MWSAYVAFLGFAAMLTVVPGPGFAVVTRNTLVGGRRRGRWTALGVTTSNAVQGTLAASGLSALIVHVEPLFEAVKWAGAAYLAMLGIQAFASAARGRYEPVDDDDGRRGNDAALGGWRQGFLTNITNPKVLVFYLAVLPQFLHPGAGPAWVLAFAWSHAVLGLLYLLALTAGLDQARELLRRRRVRRALDGATGLVLVAFGARLATEHA